MGSPRYSELGLSLGILEEDLRWYWKLLASISAWLLLAGYVEVNSLVAHRISKDGTNRYIGVFL